MNSEGWKEKVVVLPGAVEGGDRRGPAIWDPLLSAQDVSKRGTTRGPATNAKLLH